MLCCGALVAIFLLGFAKADNFPSLITTNATLAIVIDKDFMAEDYENIKNVIENYIVFAKREILKHGGVNVQYYSWASINVKRDISAIVSIASCSDTWRLFKAANDESIFHMAISESDCPRLPPNHAITIPLVKKGEEMPQLLLDLRTSNIYRWKSAAIIYDNTLNRDMTTRILTAITKEGVGITTGAAAVSLIHINTDVRVKEQRQAIQDVLSTISTKVVGKYFAVLVNSDVIELVMEYAKTYNLANIRNQWLYVISDNNFRKDDFKKLKRFIKEGDNIAFLYNNTVTGDLCEGGLECHVKEVLKHFTSALDDAIQEEYELASQVSDEEWEAIRPTKIDRRDFLLRKVKMFLLKHGSCDNCTMWSMKTAETWGREYQSNISSDFTVKLLSIGNWRAIDGPSMTDELFIHVSHGFRGKNLPMVSFHNPPWQILRVNESGAVIEEKGLVFEIIKELANTLNFTYKVEIQKIIPAVVANRTSNGTNSMDIADLVTNHIPDAILDMVRNKTVAIGAAAFTVTDQAKKFVNFTGPISTQPYTFLVTRPRELSRALLFMSPFTGDTWLCLTAAIISMGPILYYIDRYSPMYEYKGIRNKGGLSSVQNCIWYMYGALLQQGGMHLPQADSARLVVGAWWLVVLVMATTYCGNLVAFLTFPKIDIPITNLDALLTKKDLVSWSFNKGNYLEDQLKLATDWKYKTLFEERVTINDNKEMIRMIKEGKHVFIDWEIRLHYIMKTQYLETDRCDFALGQDHFFEEELALIVAHDTPYLPIINEQIKNLHQVGLIQKWLKDYLPKRDRCWKNRHLVEVNNHTVNMDDMQGSFFVLFFGFVLSLIVIFGEKLLHRYASRARKKIIQPFTR